MTKGDRVVIYMPLIPEAIIAMLAVVRLGAIHSVVFGGKLNWDFFKVTANGKFECGINIQPHKGQDFSLP